MKHFVFVFCFFAMTVAQLKAQFDWLAANGNSGLELKVLAPNGVEAIPLTLELINGDQELIPENPAAPDYILLKLPQI